MLFCLLGSPYIAFGLETLEKVERIDASSGGQCLYFFSSPETRVIRDENITVLHKKTTCPRTVISHGWSLKPVVHGGRQRQLLVGVHKGTGTQWVSMARCSLRRSLCLPCTFLAVVLAHVFKGFYSVGLGICVILFCRVIFRQDQFLELIHWPAPV